MLRSRWIEATLAVALWIAGATHVGGQPPGAQPPDTVALIIGRALAGTGAIDFLRTLVDSVGPRVTGTEHSRAAAELILTTLRQARFDSARFEEYQFQPRWERGPAEVRVKQPIDRALTVGAYGWTPGTRGRVDARLVDLGRPPTRDISAGSARLSGAAVLVDVHSIGNEPVQVMRALVAQQVARAGGVAMLIPSDKPDRMVYTSGWGFYPHGPLPVLSIAKEDALFLRRLLVTGPVTLTLAVQNTVDDGSATERNVVAEIAGRDPSHVVVVGAHFDSWDFADGADDNGTGVAALIEVARILKSLDVRPDATIRFVFFSGEEQANLGSRAYVQRHAGELDATRAFVMMDDGAQLPLGFKTNGRSDLVAPLGALLAPLAGLRAADVTDGADLESDNASFMAAGVPSLTLRVAHGDYDVRHHAIADTFDKIDPRHLALDTAVMASAASIIANADNWRGSRQSLEQVQELFRKTGLTSAQELLFGPLSR